MSSEYSILETPSVSPSGELVPGRLGTVPSLSPKDTRINAKVNQNSRIGLYLSQQKDLNGDLSYEDILNGLVPADDIEILFNHISDFLKGFLFYRPELESRIQPIEILLKALVNDKQISEAAGLELIKIMNGDDFE